MARVLAFSFGILLPFFELGCATSAGSAAEPAVNGHPSPNLSHSPATLLNPLATTANLETVQELLPVFGISIRGSDSSETVLGGSGGPSLCSGRLPESAVEIGKAEAKYERPTVVLARSSQDQSEFLKAKLKENEGRFVSVQGTFEVRSKFEAWYAKDAGISEPPKSSFLEVNWAEDIRKGWILFHSVRHTGLSNELSNREWKSFDGSVGVNALYPDGRTLFRVIRKPVMPPELRLDETPFWLAGLRADGKDAGLSTLIAQANRTELVRQVVDGSEFEGLAFEYALRQTSPRRIVVFLDPGHQYLPRRIECSSSDKIRYIATTTEYCELADPLSGEMLWFPRNGVLQRHMDGKFAFASEFAIKEVELNKDLKVEQFRFDMSSLPSGVLVTDEVNQKEFIVDGRKDLYIEMTRRFFPRTPISEDEANSVPQSTGTVLATLPGSNVWLWRGLMVGASCALVLIGIVLRRSRAS